MNNVKMLYYDGIDFSEGIDVNMTSESKERHICHYWCFLYIGFEFQSDVFDGCLDILMISMSLSNIAILNIKGADYCCTTSGISKSEVINLSKTSIWPNKAEHYKIYKFYVTYQNR